MHVRLLVMKSTATHRSAFSRSRISRRGSPFPPLKAAWVGGRSSRSSRCILEPLLTSIQYKNGAIFRGTISHRPGSGSGKFLWISGLQYGGQFKDDQREGVGELIWPDGSRYEGEFHSDVREGKGKHFWKDSGEVRYQISMPGIGMIEVSSRYILENITMTSVMATGSIAGHLERLSGGHSERT